MADAMLDSQIASGELIAKVWRNTTKLGADSLTIEVLQNRLSLLETYWKEYVNRHQALFAHRVPLKESEYFTSDLFSDVEASYIDTRVKLLNKLSEKLGAVQELLSSNSNTATDAAYRVQSTTSSLPKLKLPRFNGKQEEWDTFKEIFSSMVTRDPSLPPVLKLQHLLSCLEGEAARRVANFQVVGANFEVAWKTLETRYDNPRLRLAVQMNRLIGMRPASAKSAAEITRLLDTTTECKRAMQGLGRPVETWDDWFVQLIVFNLDSTTREDWEKSLEGVQTFPTFDTLAKFLENRTKAMDTARSSDSNLQSRFNHKTSNTSYPNRHNSQSFKSVSAHFAASPATKKGSTIKFGCLVCKADHFTAYCPTLLKKDIAARREAVEKLRLCFNCLKAKHSAANCPSKNRCRHCNKDHHTILHLDGNARNMQTLVVNKVTPDSTTKASTSLQGFTTLMGSPVLLATAQVILCNGQGKAIQVRALVDTAAECSFVSEKVAQALSLDREPTNISVSGVGAGVTANAPSLAKLILKSKLSPNFSFQFSAAVLPQVTALLPRSIVKGNSWKHLTGIQLADPDFGKPAPVDCLLGGEVYPSIVLQGLRRGSAHTPVAQNTRLGWILTGPAKEQQSERGVSAFSAILAEPPSPSTSDLLRRFWEVEDLPPQQSTLSEEEEACERHFSSTHSRDKDGRYIVRLPFKEQPFLHGSYGPALHRLLSMERKLSREDALRSEYVKFLSTYKNLDHMVEISFDAIHQTAQCFLPHHAVVKQDDRRKLRVVFDASQSSPNGRSLNSFLHTGPKLQLDITTVLNRWRKFRYVFTADIIKMFRQILVHPDDTTWQQILWRESPDQTIRIFRLRTVTYGTACAPYLAIKVLRQLAEDEGEHYPIGARILREHIYVDDALAGGGSVKEAIEASQQLINILQKAGMQLDKWAANDPLILPGGCHSNLQRDVSLHQEEVVSTLGLRWSPTHDYFHFQVKPHREKATITKRVILAEVARLYDPLGWLAPVIVRAKVLLQLLWITGKDWDVPVDDDTRNQWDNFCHDLHQLEQLRFPRWLGTNAHSTWHLHGFSDASEKAYAAAVYLVVVDHSGVIHSSLVMAKSKVAPIKTLSIPRLELCGALLLAKLLCKVQEDLGCQDALTFCWTDSKVVLAWLQGRPSSWHTFVANRVSQILTFLPNTRWDHIRSASNPADLATRGTTPAQLLDSLLWWKGPSEIFEATNHLAAPTHFTTSLEERTFSSAFHTAAAGNVEELLSRFSSLKHMLRVISFVLRWSCRSHSPERFQGTLSAAELEKTRNYIIVRVQEQHFETTFARLREDKPLRKDDPLRRLSPFMDQDGILRVGGRLQFSFLAENEKHQVLIPRRSHLAELLIRNAHLATLHGGPQLTQSYLLRSYWIPKARNLIRSFYRQCVRCTRFAGRTQDQLMAPLPRERVTPTRPFHITGLDYAGPFAIRTSKGRGQHSSKGYVAIFTCFATRAVHIEVVSDLAAKTFLLAFRRFVARRGLCHTIVSDNGTAFQGADSELRSAFEATSSFNQEVATAIQSDGVTWTFIPPRAPHFGGLWEAAVKSFKHHLRRVIGETKLTFEEFSTLAASIEACLNSRPLSPLSSDPADVAALTPGHFLVGTALTAPPEPFHCASSVSGLKRWQLTSQMRNHFWCRWRKEVIHHMQQRSKWLNQKAPPNVGDLVLLTDDQQPPLKWPLGRIEMLHPGPDGLTRVATLRTSTTTLQRPLTRLIVLPINEAASAHFAQVHICRSDNQGEICHGGRHSPCNSSIL